MWPHQVSLVRKKATGDLFALKRLRKIDVLRRDQVRVAVFPPCTLRVHAHAGNTRVSLFSCVSCLLGWWVKVAHVRAERDLLSELDNDWIVKLFYSFQDSEYLYLVMEYLPGGDLWHLLTRYNYFTEEETRFFIAETLLAIEAVHKIGYVHRYARICGFSQPACTACVACACCTPFTNSRMLTCAAAAETSSPTTCC